MGHPDPENSTEVSVVFSLGEGSVEVMQGVLDVWFVIGGLPEGSTESVVLIVGEEDSEVIMIGGVMAVVGGGAVGQEGS